MVCVRTTRSLVILLMLFMGVIRYTADKTSLVLKSFETVFFCCYLLDFGMLEHKYFLMVV